MGGGAVVTQNILSTQTYKILDLAKLFLADALIKKKHKKSCTPSRITLKYGSKNRPWFEGLKMKSNFQLQL